MTVYAPHIVFSPIPLVLAVAVFEFRATNLFKATSFAEAEVTYATEFIVLSSIPTVRLVELPQMLQDFPLQSVHEVHQLMMVLGLC